VHLINQGITTSAKFGVSIEWGLSAPSSVEREKITFKCSLDGKTPLPCKFECRENYANSGVALKIQVVRLQLNDVC